MHDVLAARDGILFLLFAKPGEGGGARSERSIELVNLGPAHAFVACRIAARGAPSVAIDLHEPFLAPGARATVFARRLFVDGSLGGNAPVGRPRPQALQVGKPLLLEADVYAGDRQLRATCVIAVSGLPEDGFSFETLSAALVPSR